MIEFAIIAAGEGSRLKADGFPLPKPLLPLAGVPMIERLIRIFEKEGAQKVHVLLNSQSPELLRYLEDTVWSIPVICYVKDTSSSLHSLYALYKFNPTWEACCVTTTDTVFSAADFSSYLKGFAAHQSGAAYMAVTEFIDDESPLYVDMDEKLEIQAFADSHDAGLNHVSAGVYGLRKEAFAALERSVALGYSRMRNYQRYLLESKLLVQGHVMGKVIDVDNLKDRDAAELFLLGTSKGGDAWLF